MSRTVKILITAFVFLLLLGALIGLLVHYLGKPKESNSTDRESPEQLLQLFDEFQQWRLKSDPEFATNRGVVEYNGELRSYKLSLYQEMYEKSLEFLERARSLEHLVESEDDRINYDTFVYDVTMFVEGYKHRGFLFPVTNLDGPQLQLPEVVEAMSLKTERDYRQLLARYSSFPRQVEELISLMRQGIREKRTTHQYSMGSVKNQFDGIQVPYEKSPFYRPFTTIPDSISAEVADTLREEGRRVVEEELLPAFKKLGDFVAQEYMRHLRPQPASSSLPDGRSFYQQCLKYHTSTDLTPEEIHQLGLQEVQRITKEMKKIIEELGFNDTIREFSERLRNDPRVYFSDGDAIIEAARNITDNLIIPRLTWIFKKVPKTKMLIVPAPASSANGTTAYHITGTADGRPGKYVLNTADVKIQPKYQMMTLSLHEGYPGHHLQSSFLLEATGLPDFRHNVGDGGCVTYSNAPSCFAMHVAYTEGWALYSEDLGFDLDLYDDPYTRYGHYSKEIYRACRLVVDSGLHAMNWTKDQAVNFMMDNIASTVRVVKNEVNRYVTWPGQACAYKVGELKIQELKRKAKESLGQKFNIKVFHDVLLKCAGPLFILEKCVDTYIQETK